MLVCASPGDAPEVLRRAGEAGVPATLLGGAGGDRFVVDQLVDLALADLERSWRDTLPSMLAVDGAR